VTGVDGTLETASDVLGDIERTEKRLLEIVAGHVGQGQPMYSSHFFLMGIGRRTLAQSRAIRQLIEDKNHLVVVALIRLQLDTAFRLHAIFWVDDPEAFSKRVFEGGQINRIKAADGQPMTDKYLKEKLLADYPWMDEVYENASGAVHFSARHISAAFSAKGAADGTINLALGPINPDHTLEDYHELLAVTRHINAIINQALETAFGRLEAGAPMSG
jgi:hypothetical protein